MTSNSTPARRFKFGVQASKAATQKEWTELARTAESNGFDTLTMPDHFTDQLAPVPALMAAASATKNLRIGALVWDNDYKHPVVLAKELATLDLLSDGRLEIGIGAGWMATDYVQSGIQYDRPGVRIDRFLEGLEIIKRAMLGEKFSFSGQHYTITDYVATPLPVQRPCPPILIGGGGKRVLKLAADLADIVGINPSLKDGVVNAETISEMSAEAVTEKVDLVKKTAALRMSQVELNIRTFLVSICDSAKEAIEGTANMFKVAPELVANSPFALMGPPAKIAEDLLARRDRWGFSYIIVGGEDVENFAPVIKILAGK
ncbi:MAG: TIGR03621 family F420-dependent LLM class oxidoreductase [Actinobacteria bacterium]|nr:TIGR03621 family F420-dependent LLM class oxidoreductase [Actinomycetota bacterium]